LALSDLEIVMELLWVYLSLAAGTLQTIRNATSKTLTKQLRPHAITLVRFGYAIPFTLLYILLLVLWQFQLGELTYSVFFYALLTALVQITGNFLLVSLFRYKNFAVAVNFSKTDFVFAAIIGAMFFGQYISFWGIIAIILALVGAFCANANKGTLDTKTVCIGLASGLAFAIASFTVRFTNDSYAGGDLVLNAGMSLLIVLVIQTTILLLYHLVWEREQLKIVMQHKATDLIIGTSSAMGSICWFLAFSLANVAFVRTVGQIEVVWTILASHLLFKERLKPNEWVGITLTVFGIMLLVFSQ
jgi:drug/metabolite transporter (DMT)-like permease